MSEEDNLFQPDQVYKQIEWLNNAQSQHTPQSSDARLISNLRQVQAEDREIVEHVWAKLAAQARTNEQQSQGQFKQYRPENMVKGFQPMQNISHTKRPKRPIIRFLELSAAILVIGALVGGMLILLQKTRQQPGNVGTVGQQYPYPLTQITSDGQHYALLSMNKDTQKLVTGSLAGGVPTTLVEHNFGNSNVLLLAGIGVF